MDISPYATSPCDGLVAGRRELRHGARLVPLCGIPEYLDQQASKSKNFAPESGSFSLFSGTATDVLRHALENIVERECVQQRAAFGCELMSPRVIELNHSMAA